MVITVLKEQGKIVLVFERNKDLESPLILGLIEKIEECVLIGSSNPGRYSLHINTVDVDGRCDMGVMVRIKEYFNACNDDVSFEGELAELLT